MESGTPNIDLNDGAPAQYPSWLDPEIPAEDLNTSNTAAASLEHAPTSSSLENRANELIPLSAVNRVPSERQDSTGDINLQAAIQLSFEEAEKHKEQDLKWDRLLNGEDVSDKKGKNPETCNDRENIGRPSLEDRIQDLSLNGVPELALMYDPLGDTHVYLDPPARQPEQDESSYFRYTQRHKIPMLMRKRTLLSFGLAFFEKLFGPTYQHRIIRRRHLVGKLPPNVKYVIDLTPPAEGEEAVLLMTELCCSDGVRKWFLASNRWGISGSLVGGREDYIPTPRFQNPDSAAASNPLGQVQREQGTSSQGIMNLPLDYSPIRHRSAIERVLAAMQGLDPKLDSAPKVWTTFAVAKYFGIINSPLTDYIVRWLRVTPNSYFLEVMPEVSLKIADGLQCHDLCRDVFAILVGEEALASFHRRVDKNFGNRLSVYGRKKDDLPETYQTSIEYASKAFADRIMGLFSFLVDDNMNWFEYLPEFQKLALDGPLSFNAANELLAVRSTLQLYVRGAIHKVLCTDYISMPNFEEGQVGADDLLPTESWASIWMTLLPHERVLTRSFWKALEACNLFAGQTNFDIGHDRHQYWPMEQISAVEVELRNCGTMESVKTADMEDMVARLNRLSVFNSNGLEASVEDNNPAKGSRHTMPWKHINSLSRNSKLKNDVPELQLGSTSLDCLSSDYWWEHDSTDNLLPAKKEILNLVSAQLAVNAEDHSIGESSRAVGMEPGERFFNLPRFFTQVKRYLGTVSTRMLALPDAATRKQTLELGLTDTLVCLTSSEWKFLPLWAGGNNDGSGGVFNDDVPLSHTGFSTAGPGVRTNSSSTSTSEFTIVNGTGTSGGNTSLKTNDGQSSIHAGKVVSLSGSSVVSDDRHSTHGDTNLCDGGSETATLDSDFTMLIPEQPEDSENEMERAERLVSTLEAEEERNMDIGEDYDDLFVYDDSSDEEDDSDEGGSVENDADDMIVRV